MANIAKVKYGKLIKRRWAFVTVITLIVLLLSLVVTLVQPFQYESEVKILVIQKSAVSIDAYSASKSAERIGRNLGQVIYSSSFFTQVLNSGFDIDRSYFSDDEDKKRKQWQQMIAAEVPAGTTILEIKAYHRDRTQATNIAQAIAYVLDAQAEAYVGIPDIDLKVVDAPLTSNYPVKPNFILNSLLGLVLGFFIAVASLLISYGEDQKTHEMFHHVGQDDENQSFSAKNSEKLAHEEQYQIDLPPVDFSGEEADENDEEIHEAEEPDKHTEELEIPEFDEEGEIKTMKK